MHSHLDFITELLEKEKKSVAPCGTQRTYGVIQPLIRHAAGLCHSSGMLTISAVSSFKFLTDPACTDLTIAQSDT